MAKRQITLDNQIASSELKIWADGARVRQVILNLLSNAVKYNHPRGTVTVSGQIVDQLRFRLSISDTGPGLCAEEIDQLFKPFSRLEHNCTAPGAGNGLAITKHIIEAMGGQVGVSSVKGEGSTFWLDFERCRAPVPKLDEKE